MFDKRPELIDEVATYVASGSRVLYVSWRLILIDTQTTGAISVHVGNTITYSYIQLEPDVSNRPKESMHVLAFNHFAID